MPITLGSVTFDESHTAVREKQDEIGGRDAREVEVAGLVVGESTVADVEGRLDAILGAASDEDCDGELSIRAGRRLLVRRKRFTREIDRDNVMGSFELVLEADDPYEEASEETSADWSVTGSGDTKQVASGGTAPARCRLTLVAAGSVVAPSISDGEHTIAYTGTVADGQTLVFDGSQGTVTLEGDDVTPYSSGSFPEIDPGGTTLTYQDDNSSSHTAQVAIAFRDRWY